MVLSTLKALVEDDTSLFAGMKNLALSYFDTTSEANKHGETKKHFSFQTTKGEGWADVVKDILGDTTIQDFGEKGKEYMKKAVKGAIAVGEGEAGITAAFVSYLTDFIVDKATEAFSNPKAPVQEKYEQGIWVYIDRGRKVNKLHMREEMASESSMFFDSDETLTKDLTTRMFSPGFYVNHVEATNQSLVYCFDVEGPEIVHYSKIREADLEDRYEFDRNTAMTLIREEFIFKTQIRDSVDYAKFQVGDEVLYNQKAYSCVKATVDTITLKDVDNNLIDVDPQACTKGQTDHWTPQVPGMFRTAEFTLSIGDWVYRELTNNDISAGNETRGILTCIKELHGENAICIDAWSGGMVSVDANRLVKPPFSIRRLLDSHDSFHTVKRNVMKGFQTSGVAKNGETTAICYGFDQTLVFPQRTTIRTEGFTEGNTTNLTAQGSLEVKKATIMVPDQPTTTPAAQGDGIGSAMWVIVGAGAFLLLFF